MRELYIKNQNLNIVIAFHGPWEHLFGCIKFIHNQDLLQSHYCIELIMKEISNINIQL